MKIVCEVFKIFVVFEGWGGGTSMKHRMLILIALSLSIALSAHADAEPGAAPATRPSPSERDVDSLREQIQRLRQQLASAQAELTATKAELAKLKAIVAPEHPKPLPAEPQPKSTFSSRAKYPLARTPAQKVARDKRLAEAKEFDQAIAAYVASHATDVKTAEALYEAKPVIGMSAEELRLFATLEASSETAGSKSFRVMPHYEGHFVYAVLLMDGKVAKIAYLDSADGRAVEVPPGTIAPSR